MHRAFVILERVSGIEPPSQLWKSCIIATIRPPPTLALRASAGRPAYVAKARFLFRSVEI